MNSYHTCYQNSLSLNFVLQLHRFGFDFCRDEGKKILDKDTAQVMLRCLMDNRWSLIDVFNAYFQVLFKFISFDEEKIIFLHFQAEIDHFHLDK